jgi:mono/diheme cytochrome c family protein
MGRERIERTGVGVKVAGVLVLVSALVGAAGCTRIDNALASIPIFAFMRSAPSFDPYEAPRPAPAGSVPFKAPTGVLLPPIEPLLLGRATDAALQAFASGPYGQDPYADEDLTEMGRTMYDRHCLVCHGAQGLGGQTGTITRPDRYTFPVANLTQPSTVARSDGYLYGIIRAGRSLMPAYGPRTTHRQRWAIVQYVRHLQTQAGGTPPAGGTGPGGTGGGN